MTKIKPVIMAGGSGTRLWPLSCTSQLKQFTKMFGNESLLQKTLLRNSTFGKPLVIVGEEHRFIAAEQIREINIEADLMIEPASRNTAPCAILASLVARQENFETVLLLPVDHYIDQKEQYLSIINKSFDYAKNIVTIGIRPKSAHTGYGYIKTCKSFEHRVFKAKKFVEKPDLEEAETYMSEGNYFWNSGIFVFNADFMIKQAKILQSKLFEQVQLSFSKAIKDLDFVRLSNQHYSQIKSISIDHAIMENLSDMILLEADFTWNDLGNWNSIWEISSKDERNNHQIGNVVLEDVNNSYIMSDKKLTTVMGLDNIVVISISDRLLITDKSKSENLKNVINQLIKSEQCEVSKYMQSLK